MRRSIGLLLLVLCMAALCPFGYSQMALTLEGSGVGIVKDVNTGEAIPFANISIRSSADSTFVTGVATDMEGRFIVTELPIGVFMLDVQVLGYAPHLSSVFEVRTQPWSVDFGVIALAPQAQALEAVVVEAVRNRMETVPGGYALQIDEQLAASNVDAGALLRIVPGVFIDQSGTFELLGRTDVRVKIDGRFIELSGRELLNYLQEIPSQEIESIIVKTTPGAAESAQGSAGIIEIKTNRAKKRGLISQLFTTVGSRDKYSGGVASMFNSERWSAYGRLNFRHDNYIEKTTERYTYFENGTASQLLDYRERNVEEVNSYAAQASLDYALTEHTTIGAIVKGQKASMNNNPGAALTTFTETDGSILSVQEILTTSNWSNERYFTNINYRSSFGMEGHEFKLEYSLNYRDWYNNLLLEEENRQSEQLTDSETYTRNADFLVRVHEGLADYSLPLSNGAQVEMGARYTAATIYGNLENQDYDPAQQIFMTDRNNSFELFYQENIGAAYFNYKQQWEAFAFEAGLRAEHTAFDLKTLGKEGWLYNKRDRLNWFPSAMLKYYINEEQSLSVSVGQRIDRPRFYTLNPYQVSPNPNVELRGNPALRPSLDYKLDLSYAINWKNRYSMNITTGYLHSNDPYTYITIPQADAGNFLSIPENIDFSTFAYCSINSNNELTDWWSLSANVFANRITQNGESLGIVSPDPVVSYSASLTNNFNLWKGANLQIHGAYKSPQTSLYGWANGYQTIDLSFSKAFLSNKLRLNVYLTDVFNINENAFQYNTGNVASEGRWKYETRVAFLRLSYTFGKRIQSKARRHQAEEDSRYEE